MPYFTVIRPIITVHNIVHIIVLPPASKNLISTRCRLTKVHRTMRLYATLIYQHITRHSVTFTLQSSPKSQAWITQQCWNFITCIIAFLLTKLPETESTSKQAFWCSVVKTFKRRFLEIMKMWDRARITLGWRYVRLSACCNRNQTVT